MISPRFRERNYCTAKLRNTQYCDFVLNYGNAPFGETFGSTFFHTPSKTIDTGFFQNVGRPGPGLGSSDAHPPAGSLCQERSHSQPEYSNYLFCSGTFVRYSVGMNRVPVYLTLSPTFGYVRYGTVPYKKEF
jgi:hypothetical protein